MERDYDEIISEILIQLAEFEIDLKEVKERVTRISKRVDFTIKRQVGLESRMELMDQLMREYKVFVEKQSKLDRDFIDFMEKYGQHE